MSQRQDRIAGDAHWPIRLADACGRLRATRDPEERRGAQGDLWTLLYFGLLRCLRAGAARHGMQGIPDLEDIASKKSLEMLRRAESGAMDLSGKKATDVVAFLSAVARHGLLDLKRAEGRNPVASLPPEGEPFPDGEPGWRLGGSPPAPHSLVESKDFARALRSCVAAMPVRSVRIWYFRVFFGMSSREIASHPEVKLNAPHVDVLLQRARAALKECMEEKGHAPTELPRGTFTELWEYFRAGQPQSKACEETAMGIRDSRAGKVTPATGIERGTHGS